MSSTDPQQRSKQWTSTVVLGDGSTATIRPIEPNDANTLQAFHRRQSDTSNYFRYFSPKPDLSSTELQRFTVVDMVNRVALVVEQHGEFVGWASYERWKGRPDAEVAFQVDDQHQGKGIATLLLEHLAAIARTNGITRFTAETLTDNRAMISVFSRAGWPLQRRFESGVIDVDFPLEDSSEFLDSVDRREQRADSRAVARLLMPRTIAVIGASDKPGTIGHALWQHTSSDDRIPVYPVNPAHDTVGGVAAADSVSEISAEIDLAVIAVPWPQLPDVIDDCIAKRVRGAVLVTAPNDSTADDELDALIRHARRNGLRIIGPASMGIASPMEPVSINATLVEVALQPGPVAISTQSGTLGASVLRLARDLDVGLSWFVSLGERGDVSSNDLLQFWDDDAATRVICLYTESVGNPRKFARIAHRVARRRPIIVVRTGAAMSGLGTGAMYRRSGVIEVPTVHAMLDTARLMASQPLMDGDRVAIVSNARSPRTAGEAALAAAGLIPVDPPRQLDWQATPGDYADAISQALRSVDIDALVVINAPPTEHAVGEPNLAIANALQGANIPCCAVMLGDGDGALLSERHAGIASFAFPEQAAEVLSRLRAYSIWRATESNSAPAEPFGIRRQHASHLIDAELSRLDGPATAEDRHIDLPRPEMIRDLLASYGITMPKTRLVDAEDAIAAAEEIGYPVAVKAIRRQAGTSVRAGIGLDLTDANSVAEAVAEMQSSLGDGADAVWVQSMVGPGHEVRATAEIDESYGPIVSTGLGGYEAEAIGDVASRIAPLAPSSARHLIADTRAADVLDTAETTAMVDLLVRLAQLVSDHAEIRRLDLNPIMVSGRDANVVDATLELARPTRPGAALRRLEAD